MSNFVAMRRLGSSASLAIAIALFATAPAQAQDGAGRPAAKAAKAVAKQPVAHLVAVEKLVIQVNDNDPKLHNLALNNAKNVAEYYAAKGQKVDIQIVTYGPGLHMLRSDTSAVKQRIAAMSLENTNIAFAACGNTRSNMAKQEGKDIPLISEAKLVPSGVVQIMELQKSGYAYLRP